MHRPCRALCVWHAMLTDARSAALLHATCVLEYGNAGVQASGVSPHMDEAEIAVSTWMVKTMPTKLAVSSATPSERGPTSDSCSRVLRQWILPAVDRRTGRKRRQHAPSRGARTNHPHSAAAAPGLS